jgi:hypothetical protein
LEDKSLKISRVKVDDEGLYVCKAENPVGTIEAVGRLTVHCKYHQMASTNITTTISPGGES